MCSSFIHHGDVAVLRAIVLVVDVGPGGAVGAAACDPDEAQDEDAEVGEAGADYGNPYFAHCPLVEDSEVVYE